MTTGRATSAFPVRYALSVPRPPMDLELTVAADGSFVADVLTGTTLPQVLPPRLGSFRGWLEAVSAAALAEFAVRASGSGPAGAAAGDGGAQYVALAGGRLVPAPDLDARLVRSLIEASTKAIASPLAAIEVGARAGASGIELVIRSIGSEAVPIVLFERANPDMWARLWRDDPSHPDGRRYVERETLAQLADDGQLADGVIRLDPSTEVRVPLPATGSTTGGFVFWRPGTGLERRPFEGAWELAPPA